MEILRTIVAGAALAACAGCGLERPATPWEPMDEEISVHSVLLAGTDTASVLLTRVRWSYQTWDEPYSTPLAGATVRLITGRDTLRLLPQSGEGDRCTAPSLSPWQRLGDMRAGCYLAAVPGGVRAGGRYELVIDLPDGGAIRGSAVVPEVPVILAPEGGTVFKVRWGFEPGGSASPVVVRWAGVERDQNIELAIAPVRRECSAGLQQASENSGLHWLTVLGVDSVAIEARFVDCRKEQAPPSLDAHLYLTAFDTTYTRYAKEMRRGGSASRTKAAAGVSGAIGVFAGAAAATVPITLVQ
jgi:hypothetical protein